MRPLSHYLNPTLSALYEKVEYINKIQERLEAHLPDTLKSHCFVIGYHSGNLVIGVHDPIYLTPLRYQLTELRTALRREEAWCHLVSIQLKIQPLSDIVLKKPQSVHHVSEVGRMLLVEISRKITYAPLSQALQALAKQEEV